MSSPIALTADVLMGAMGSVFIRGLLTLADRRALGYRKESVAITLFFNALFPLLLVVMGLAVTGQFDRGFIDLLLHPGVIGNGMLTHIAASAYYLGYQKMPVRTVLAVSKLSDLFLPATILLLGKSLNWADASFSVISTLFFVPFLSGISPRRASWRNLRILVVVIAMPLVQVMINSWSGIEALSQGLMGFMQVFAAILTWRFVIVCIAQWRTLPQVIIEQVNARGSYIPWLAARSLMAVFAHGLFFFAVTREAGALAWPILNAGPLVSSAFAHWLLKERMRPKEIAVLVAFAVALLLCTLVKQSSF